MVAVRLMQQTDCQCLLRGEQVICPYRACAYHLAGGFDFKGVAHILKISYTFHIIIYGELYELQIGPIRQ